MDFLQWLLTATGPVAAAGVHEYVAPVRVGAGVITWSWESIIC